MEHTPFYPEKEGYRENPRCLWARDWTIILPAQRKSSNNNNATRTDVIYLLEEILTLPISRHWSPHFFKICLRLSSDFQFLFSMDSRAFWWKFFPREFGKTCQPSYLCSAVMSNVHFWGAAKSSFFISSLETRSNLLAAWRSLLWTVSKSLALDANSMNPISSWHEAIPRQKRYSWVVLKPVNTVWDLRSTRLMCSL